MENNNIEVVAEEQNETIEVTETTETTSDTVVITENTADASKLEEPKYNDRHTQANPFKDGKPYKELEDKQVANSIIIPVSTYNKVMDFINKVDKLDPDFVEDSYTEDQKDVSRLNSFGIRYTVKDDVLVQDLEDALDRKVNRINYSDKKLNISSLALSTDSHKKLTPSQATLMFRTLLSVGEAIQVPLWHSGFWINLKPPTQTDIINLQIALTNSEIELGRNTNTLIYSNYAVVFNRIITDFIIRHIDDTTLIIPEGEDIRKYILVHDYYPLVLGILATMYPKGINVIKSCINSTYLDKDNKPKCDFIVSATLDSKKLLWVDRTVLSDKMLSHMSNRVERTMTVDSIKEYQLSINNLIDKEYEIVATNEAKFKVKFSLPTILDYITNGERWVNTIVKKAEGLFTSNDTQDEKNTKINNIALSGILGIYNIFVKEIYISDTPISDYDAILDMLSTASSDDKAFTEFITQVEKFITTSAIAIVGTPSYTCPTCNTNQTANKTGPFKEFIPFNIVEHFFVLCALRAEKTQSRAV